MRAQLAQPNEHFITKQSYNELFTIHGTTMIFLVVVPIFAGFANFLVPLMIGARDVAFPRLNALSYWLFLFGGIVLYLSFFTAYGASRSGWYAYPPLSEDMFSLGNGQDLWILSLHLLSLGSLLGAIDFLATIHNMRAPGMSWMRIPLFVWSIEIYAALLVLVLPVLSGFRGSRSSYSTARRARTSSCRKKGAMRSFTSTSSGSSATPRSTSWSSRPWGSISEVIPVFSRKPIFGYKAIAFSTVAIGFYSMLVWAHHMFSVGMPNFLNVFFMLSSMVIAVPTGVKIFNWLATTWRGNLIFDTAMLWALGFIAVFTIGGLLRDLPRRIPRRLAGDRHLLRRRTHALRALRGLGVRDLRGPLLLVAEDLRAHAGRTAREGSLLARVPRLQSHLLPATHAGTARDAAADLHLPAARPVAGVQPDLFDRVRAS